MTNTHHNVCQSDNEPRPALHRTRSAAPKRVPYPAGLFTVRSNCPLSDEDFGVLGRNSPA